MYKGKCFLKHSFSSWDKMKLGSKGTAYAWLVQGSVMDLGTTSITTTTPTPLQLLQVKI